MAWGLGLKGTMLRVRLYQKIDVEVALVRKNFHEAGRLYNCLCRCNLGRGGEKSTDESGFGKHGEEDLFSPCFW